MVPCVGGGSSVFPQSSPQPVPASLPPSPSPSPCSQPLLGPGAQAGLGLKSAFATHSLGSLWTSLSTSTQRGKKQKTQANHPDLSETFSREGCQEEGGVETETLASLESVMMSVSPGPTVLQTLGVLLTLQSQWRLHDGMEFALCWAFLSSNT